MGALEGTCSKGSNSVTSYRRPIPNTVRFAPALIITHFIMLVVIRAVFFKQRTTGVKIIKTRFDEVRLKLFIELERLRLKHDAECQCRNVSQPWPQPKTVDG
jgi:hypothetical protein